MKYFLFIPVLFFFIACNNNEAKTLTPEQQREVMLKTIDSLELVLKQKQQIDKSMGSAMVNAYLVFVSNYPADENASEILFKAGDISMNIQNPQNAIGCFQKVHDEYTKSTKASMALFLLGFIYETQLNDTASARKIYLQVAAEYPNTKLAEDALASIANLGKSDDQLIKEFEEKNKKGNKSGK